MSRRYTELRPVQQRAMWARLHKKVDWEWDSDWDEGDDLDFDEEELDFDEEEELDISSWRLDVLTDAPLDLAVEGCGECKALELDHYALPPHWGRED